MIRYFIWQMKVQEKFDDNHVFFPLPPSIYGASDYPFGIIKFFLHFHLPNKIPYHLAKYITAVVINWSSNTGF
jgi:hypothetical protein